MHGTIDHLESGEIVTPLPPSRSNFLDGMLTSPAPGARAMGAGLFGVTLADERKQLSSSDPKSRTLGLPKGATPTTTTIKPTTPPPPPTGIAATVHRGGHSVASSSHHSHHRWSSSIGGSGNLSPSSPAHHGRSSLSSAPPGVTETVVTPPPPRSAHRTQEDEPKGYIVGGERLVEGVDIEGSYGPCMLVVSPGQSFGERTLTTVQPAATSVICRGDCEFMVIHKSDYARLLNRGVAGFVEDEDVQQVIEATHLASAFRNDDVLTFLDKALSEVKFFGNMSTDMRRYLFEFMLHEHVPKDTIVFQEGDPGEHVFVILKGSISLHIRDKVAGRLHGFLQRARDKSKSKVLSSLKSKFSRAKDAVSSKQHTDKMKRGGRLLELPDGSTNTGGEGNELASPTPGSGQLTPSDDDPNNGGRSGRSSAATPAPASQRSGGTDTPETPIEDDEDEEVEEALREYKRSRPALANENDSPAEDDDFDDDDDDDTDDTDDSDDDSKDGDDGQSVKKKRKKKKKNKEGLTEDERKKIRRKNWNRRKHTGGKQRERLTKKVGERLAAANSPPVAAMSNDGRPGSSTSNDSLKPSPLSRAKSRVGLLRTPTTIATTLRSPSAIAASDAQAAVAFPATPSSATTLAAPSVTTSSPPATTAGSSSTGSPTSSTIGPTESKREPRTPPLRSPSGMITLAAPGQDSPKNKDNKDGSTSPNLRLRRKTMKTGILKQLTEGAQLAAHERALAGPPSPKPKTSSDPSPSTSSTAPTVETEGQQTPKADRVSFAEPSSSITSSAVSATSIPPPIVASSEEAVPIVQMNADEKKFVDGVMTKFVVRKKLQSAAGTRRTDSIASTASTTSTISTTSTTSVHQPLDLTTTVEGESRPSSSKISRVVIAPPTEPGSPASPPIVPSTTFPTTSSIFSSAITHPASLVLTLLDKTLLVTSVRSLSRWSTVHPGSVNISFRRPSVAATPLVPASYHPATFPSYDRLLPPIGTWHPATITPSPSLPPRVPSSSDLKSPAPPPSSLLSIVPSSPLLTPSRKISVTVAGSTSPSGESSPLAPLSPRSPNISRLDLTSPISPRGGGVIPLSPSGARAARANKQPILPAQSALLKKAREELQREKKQKSEEEEAKSKQDAPTAVSTVADEKSKSHVASAKALEEENDDKSQESQDAKWPMMLKVHPPGHRGHHKSQGHIDIDTMYGPCIDILGVGHAFGEIAVMAGGPRTATIITREDTDFLLIPREAFLRTVRVKKSYSTRDKHLEMMNQSPWFARWTSATLLALSYHVEERRFTRNEVIIQQGDPDHTTYFLISGTCRVSQRLRLLPVKRPRRAPTTLEVALLEAKMKGRPPPSVATAQTFEQFFHGPERGSSVYASTASSLSRTSSGMDTGAADRHHVIAHSELQAIRAGLGLPLEESFEVNEQEPAQKSCSVKVYCRNPSSVQQALAPTQQNKKKKMSVHTTEGVALPKLKTLEVELGIVGDREQFGGTALLLTKGKFDETLDDEAIQQRVAAIEAKDKAAAQAARASIDGPPPPNGHHNHNVPVGLNAPLGGGPAPPALATVIATSDVRLLVVRTMALKHFMPKRALARLKKTVTRVAAVHTERMHRCLEVRVVAAVRRIEEDEASLAAGATASAALNVGTVYRGVSTSLSSTPSGQVSNMMMDSNGDMVAATIPSTSAYHVLHSTGAFASNADDSTMVKTSPQTPPSGDIHVTGMTVDPTQSSSTSSTSSSSSTSSAILSATQAQHAELRRLRQDALATGSRWTKQLANLLDTGFEAKAEELKENARSALRSLAEQHMDETMDLLQNHPAPSTKSLLSSSLSSILMDAGIDPSSMTRETVDAVLNGGPGGSWATEFNDVHRVFGILPVDVNKLPTAPRLATTATARAAMVSAAPTIAELLAAQAESKVSSRIHLPPADRPSTHHRSGPPFPGALLHYEDRPATRASSGTTRTSTSSSSNNSSGSKAAAARYASSRAMSREVATTTTSERKTMSRTAPIITAANATTQVRGRPVTSSGATADPTQFRAQIMAKVLTAGLLFFALHNYCLHSHVSVVCAERIGSGSVVDDLARLHRYLPPPSPVWVQFANYVPSLVHQDEDQQMETVRRGWHKHRSTPTGPQSPAPAHSAGVLPVNDGQTSRNRISSPLPSHDQLSFDLCLTLIPFDCNCIIIVGVNFIPRKKQARDALQRAQQNQQRVVQQSMSLPELRSGNLVPCTPSSIDIACSFLLSVYCDDG
jgi:CRP-like cAMP-binding protein